MQYTFKPGGNYEYASLTEQTMYNCTTKFSTFKTGIVDIRGGTLTFIPQTSTFKSEDSCVAKNNYRKPAGLDRESYNWSIQRDEGGVKLCLQNDSVNGCAYKTMTTKVACAGRESTFLNEEPIQVNTDAILETSVPASSLMNFSAIAVPGRWAESSGLFSAHSNANTSGIQFVNCFSSTSSIAVTLLTPPRASLSLRQADHFFLSNFLPGKRPDIRGK